MADEIEKVINEKAKDGWQPVSLFRDQFLQGDSCVPFAGRHRKMIRMQKADTISCNSTPHSTTGGCSCIGFCPILKASSI